MKNIDADYYGYRDEDDGRIIPLEQEMEKKGLIILWSYKQQPWLPSLHDLYTYMPLCQVKSISPCPTFSMLEQLMLCKQNFWRVKSSFST